MPKGAINVYHLMFIPKDHIESFDLMKPEEQKEMALSIDRYTNYLASIKFCYFLFERKLPFKFENQKHLNL